MRKALIVFTLATSLAGPPARLEPLWGLLSSLWGKATADIGCGFDPYGQCEPQPQPDEGCGFDPYGCPKGS
jgi:hypothetical protein